MRHWLQGSGLSVEMVMQKLSQIKAVDVRLRGTAQMVLTNPTPEHKQIYKQLRLPFPRYKDLLPKDM
jgi:hypothetical protein